MPALRRHPLAAAHRVVLIGSVMATPFGSETGQGPAGGFRRRTSSDLRINFFWLLHYVTEYAATANRVANPKRENRVSFDDIVVATAYVGPIAPLPSVR